MRAKASRMGQGPYLVCPFAMASVSFKTGYKRRTFVSVISHANPAAKIAAE